eukprot:910754-Heterocapsa_arctica.AAC.1
MGAPLEGAAAPAVLVCGCAGSPPLASEGAGAGAARTRAAGPAGWTQYPRELTIIPSARKGLGADRKPRPEPGGASGSGLKWPFPDPPAPS